MERRAQDHCYLQLSKPESGALRITTIFIRDGMERRAQDHYNSDAALKNVDG